MDSIFDLDHLYRTYFKMALPSVFGLMVSVVYNLADTFFIAQSNDTALIAGVSLCAPVFTALMAFGNIYGQGGSSLISRLLGQDDREGTGRVSSFCFYVALTTGVVLAALMMLFRVPLLGILGATAETMPHAQAYYTVLAIGAPATVLNFIHSNLVRCEGMATQSMIGSIGGTVNQHHPRSHPHHHSGLGRRGRGHCHHCGLPVQRPVLPVAAPQKEPLPVCQAVPVPRHGQGAAADFGRGCYCRAEQPDAEPDCHCDEPVSLALRQR